VYLDIFSQLNRTFKKKDVVDGWVGKCSNCCFSGPWFESRLDRPTLGANSPIFKWRLHLLKGLVQTALCAHLRTFGE
jgi:hypothetical protein